MKDFSKPSDKWDRATRAAFADETHNAYINAAADAPPGIVCQNVSGSINSDCPCAHCTGSRAAHARSMQLAAPDDWGKLSAREKARFLLHPSKRKGRDGNDLPDEDIERMVAEREGREEVPPADEVPPGRPSEEVNPTGGTAVA